ncbi:Aste57867_24620 [Aphanomyces stellatus]|uniref:Chitinase domain-containing protein 1 n=1 Tax=Aphanomyces stellatus TaxID=120398 RepID=A0A485LRY6_9STRA|nr:hypothetical protein As57867_024542 [Aphanomyces stellatus]VFU01257.1 Aste57867_24620 [Aphanomyces stellatus]
MRAAHVSAIVAFLVGSTASDSATHLANDAVEAETCAADGDGGACRVPSVIERALVERTPTFTSILKEETRYGSDTHVKRFVGETLGYVTPWNNHGYDTAKLFRHKFTYIAPVWYQIRHDDKHQPSLTGGHDVDAGWISAVRGSPSDSASPSIVPRFMFEMNSLSPQESKTIVKLLRKEVVARGFDGLTLEIPVLDITVDFINALGRGLQADGKILIAVLPTSQRNGQLSTTTELISKILTAVHRFSMNAYDYSPTGPNAPLPWLQATLDALAPLRHNPKFLMGLAFYGYDTQNAIVGSQYRDLLETHKPTIEWDVSAHECFFQYANNHRKAYYPCLQSIQDRLDLYTMAKTGAAIWDIGQGLDYFFDLL